MKKLPEITNSIKEDGKYTIEEDLTPNGEKTVYSVSFFKIGYEDSPEFIKAFDSLDEAREYVSSEIDKTTL